MTVALKKPRIVAVLVVVGALLLPASVALANAGPPPVKLWLDFVFQTSGRPDLEGVQLAQCDTPECDRPTLLQQYGTCDSEGCLDLSPSLVARHPLDCVGSRCLAVFISGDELIPPFKIIGDFSDRVRESAWFSHELPSYGATITWEITVQDTALGVTVPARSIKDPYDAYFDSFFLYFALTIIIELLAAATILSVWLELRKRSLLQGLAYVLLAGLISYPVTWIVWPSLGQFQPIVMRQMGAFIIFGAVVFTSLLVVLSRKEGKARRNWWIVILILLPLSVIVTLLGLLLTGLGMAYSVGDYIAVQGLPSSLTIAFSEAFAISFEALLLYLLARKTLALSSRQAAFVSFTVNICSFLAGLVLSSWL